MEEPDYAGAIYAAGMALGKAVIALKTNRDRAYELDQIQGYVSQARDGRAARPSGLSDERSMLLNLTAMLGLIAPLTAQLAEEVVRLQAEVDDLRGKGAG